MNTCKDCDIKEKCNFYEHDDDECVYEVLMRMKEETKRKENEIGQ